MKLWQRFLRFWHCLFTLHRGVDTTVEYHDGYRVTWICCECGREWL
jgi:hypothetical protein